MPNKKTVVRTNSTPNSIKEVPLKAVTFQELWDNYAKGDPYDDPNGQYGNQCAIRISVTFHRVGIEMKSFSQKLVKPAAGKATLGRILLAGKPTATRADELAAWLKLRPLAGLPAAEDITGPDWESKVKGRTGIIAFSRYWTRDGESENNASGGHIDLWNGAKITSNGVLGAIETFSRFSLGIHNPWIPLYSDLRKSKEIIFFEVK